MCADVADLTLLRATAYIYILVPGIEKIIGENSMVSQYCQ